MTVKLQCDAHTEKPFFDLEKEAYKEDPCRPIIYMKTKEACPSKSARPLFKFLNQNKVVEGILMIVCGLFMAAVGSKY